MASKKAQYFLLGALAFGLLLTYFAFVRQTIVWGNEFTLLAYVVVAAPYYLLARAAQRSKARVALVVTGISSLLTLIMSASAAYYFIIQHRTVGESGGVLNMVFVQMFLAVLAWMVSRYFGETKQ